MLETEAGTWNLQELRGFGHLIMLRLLFGGLPNKVQLGGAPVADPGVTAGIIYLGKQTGSPREGAGKDVIETPQPENR